MTLFVSYLYNDRLNSPRFAGHFYPAQVLDGIGFATAGRGLQGLAGALHDAFKAPFQAMSGMCRK
ncbi:hypothetical protein ABH945_001536 [Paraburkholderia sp. GAS333]|uniref:hypothetical protein n=1 Tax=Paraburkholderia sp. GAS333 TaxID=3156279 RepID=UPI003D208C0A